MKRLALLFILLSSIAFAEVIPISSSKVQVTSSSGNTVTYDNGAWVDSAAFANHSTAKEAAFAQGRMLMISNGGAVNSITFNCPVQVVKGGSITVNTGKTATFTADFQAGLYQVFTGSGAVAGLKHQYNEWFGRAINLGTETAGTGSPHYIMGQNEPSADNSALTIARNVTGANLFSHAVRDESTFSSTTSGAYASFDSIPIMSGSLNPYNHFRSFQSRPKYDGDGLLDTMDGHTFQAYGSGDITNAYGFHMYDGLTTGTVDMQVGLWVEPLTAGTSNYAIYSPDQYTPSYHGGLWQTGPNGILSAGPVVASNIKTDDTSNTAGIGIGMPSATVYHGAFVGHNAGHNTTGNENTFIGSGAGYTMTSGTGNVFIGRGAGYYATGSSILIIDNATRSAEGEHAIKSLIYGTFNSDPASQTVKINGSLQVNTTGTRPTCDSAHRGIFWLEQNGTGVKDTVTVCAKDASNNYDWRTIY